MKTQKNPLSFFLLLLSGLKVQVFLEGISQNHKTIHLTTRPNLNIGLTKVGPFKKLQDNPPDHPTSFFTLGWMEYAHSKKTQDNPPDHRA
jgi:hypothetical protein